MVLSMSTTGRAMCVHRIDGGCTAYLSVTSLTCPPLGNDWIGPALCPQNERVAPRVPERTVEGGHPGPDVTAPQFGCAEAHRRVEDSLVTVVVGHQDPHPRGATRRAGCPRFDAGGIGVWPGIGHVVDAHVQVADLGWRAVGKRKVTAGNDAVELARRPTLYLPTEHLRIEPARRFGIVTREINEDQGVRLHGSERSIVGLMV